MSQPFLLCHSGQLRCSSWLCDNTVISFHLLLLRRSLNIVDIMKVRMYFFDKDRFNFDRTKVFFLQSVCAALLQVLSTLSTVL